MGMRNKQRRAEKRKRREASGPSGNPGRDPQWPPGQAGNAQREPRRGPAPPRLDVDDLVVGAVRAGVAGDVGSAQRCVALLAARVAPVDGRPSVATSLDGFLQRAVREQWSRGWQPADLAWVVGRRSSRAHRDLVVAAVRAEAASYLGAGGADPYWLAQLHDLGADKGTGGAAVDLDPRLSPAAAEEQVRQAVELLTVLAGLPDQARLGLPPREWRADAATGGRATTAATPERGRLLSRVRGLLAKAEATSYPEEAEALSAKAQELMARHAIDAAALTAGAQPTVIGRRILLEDPYGSAKAILLQTVGDANRCRTVWSSGLGLSTVFGVGDDVEATEMLYTSLLTQATSAMVRAGRAPGSGRPTRLPSFRQSFLVAFANRIGERLTETVATAVADGVRHHGTCLLPVLARRSDAVDAAVEETYGTLSQRNVRSSNHSGRIAGRAAADMARLGLGEELSASA